MRIAVSLGLILLGCGRAVAATITVTNTADSNLGSLRGAITNALSGDKIIFAAGLSGQTIALTNGQITLDRNLTIDGSALVNPIKINGGHADRIFRVNSGVTAVLNSLILTNGHTTSDDGGAIFNTGTLTMNNSTVVGNSADGLGGGIYSSGKLTNNNCTVVSNSAAGSGGGIYNGDTLTVSNCTIVGNSATVADGGGIFSIGTLTVNNSTVMSNSAAGSGGGIYNGDTVTMSQSTVAKNTARNYGGGIENSGTVISSRCTFNGNSASGGGAVDNNNSLTAIQNTFFGNSITSAGDDGGAVWAGGTIALTNCTVVGNSAPNGTTAGIAQYAGAPMMIFNSIVALNTNGNVGGSFTGGSNLTNGNPLLSTLNNYGGLTQTMPPLSGSPAIDAGSDTVTNSFTTDQRGLPRRSGLHVDIGAAELQYGVGTNPIVLKSPTRLGNGSFRFSFTNLSAASFTVFAGTNVAQPLDAWSNLGPAVETPVGSGHFLFTDPQATTNARRFYRVRSP